MGGVVQSVSNAVSSAFQSIGNVVEQIGQSVVNDPIGSIAKVAAIATGQVELLPLISAVDVVAHGGNLEQAAISAGSSYLGAEIASTVSSAILAPASDSLSSMATSDATDLIKQGLSTDQVAQTLQQSYNLAPEVANSIANAAGAGLPAATLATAYAGAFGSQLNGVLDSTAQNILANTAGNAVGNAVKTLATTGNLDNAAMSALTGAVGTAVGGGTTAALNDTGAVNPLISNIAGKVTGAITNAAVANKDPSAAAANTFVNSLINTSLSEIGKATNLSQYTTGVSTYLTNTAKELQSNLTNQLDTLSSKQADAQNLYNNTVATSYDAAKSSYDNLISANSAYKDAYSSYQSDYSKYQDLVSQYNAAKDANDPTTANSLVSQINSLKDTLSNDASNLSTLQSNMTQANDAYTSNLSTYQNNSQQYTDLTNQIKDLNTQVTDTATQSKTQLSDYANNLVKADQQVSQMSEAAKQGFTSMINDTNSTTAGDPTAALNLAQSVQALPTQQQDYFSFANKTGLSATDSLTYAPQLATMSTTALQTFFDQTNNNGTAPADALKIASQVNSLTDTQQAALNNATSQGLSIDQALTIANSPVANLGSNAQNLYIQSLKNNTPDQLAQILSATQQLVDPGAAATNINAAAQSQLKTPDQVAAYNTMMAKNPSMNPLDAVKAVLDFIIPSANASELPGTQGTVTVTGAPSDTSTGATPSTPTLVSETTDPKTGNVTQTLSNGAVKVLDSEGNILSQTTPTTAAPTNAYQQFIDNLFSTPSTTTKPTAGKGTAPSVEPGNPNLVTPGTGTGTGGSGTSGTGVGGTGVGGTGGGAGTGSGGTGVSVPTGGIAIPTGGTTSLSPATAQTNPGITNLVGTFAPTKDASLIGLEQNQAMTNPTSSYNPYFAGFATGGSTSNLSSNSFTGVGDTSNSITGLTPSLRQVQQAALLGIPTITALSAPLSGSQYNPSPVQSVEEAAPVIHLAGGGGLSYAPVFGHGRPTALLGTQRNEAFGDLSGRLIGAHAAGGEIDDHVPEFHSEGGLQHRYVQGDGDGTSDSVKAMLANGEFVIPADVVSDLGNGSNESGAKVLDSFLSVIRAHKQKHDPKKLPPDSKGPLAYLLAAKKKAKV